MNFNEEYVKAAIDGDRRALASAFIWEDSPQGLDYWYNQRVGKTPIDVDYLKSLLGEDEKEKEMIGTLKELDVKLGDVVRHESGDAYEVRVGPEGIALWHVDEEFWGVTVEESFQLYSIISREPETPKTWGEMTDAEKGALLLAHHEGKVIEWNGTSAITGEWGEWEKCDDDCLWDATFHGDGFAYRVRPEPKRETVMLYIKSEKHSPGYQSVGTMDLIDGKPDVSSIKMEEV